ncbi:ArsJ-associated glyceraldehyde-3-phosphate dehydrogenase [Chitinivibrio alkaliphilus]|uniref:Glyceraldehyde-3-phosphate dehydrogenase n=1 Tax=Chitinivibrio alkaliphilus ACht1 TaxID=1313304 RepID=U7D621_9BACT|nr:ArsJ-associated glyceraldehyde-3-phosphate dehydrogenase [Chitinivibrio alkaliphilus]ERP31383.1 glyceraldehyde-3-phosphate dehydrogenase [Chitinivibrio alkaliphilus ACht1]
MKKRVLINGFGRMGRLFFRAAHGDPSFEIVAINEPMGDTAGLAHLLTFDSIHGTWDVPVTHTEKSLCIANREILHTQEKTPAAVPLPDIDIVVECSGAFRKEEELVPYFKNGADTVIVSAPVKKGACNIVYGVNDSLYRPDKKLLTAASCTTNCLAPVVKVLQENIGIAHGSITTIHNITNTQRIVDAPHKDLRRARACGSSLIPTTTGSATAITMIYPELTGKLNGLAVRVPLLNASLTDCVFEVERDTTAEEVNALFKEASTTTLAGILGYEERPLVSVDYTNDTRSAIIDAQSTMVVDKRQVKILAWYDNETGYVHRMSDLCRKVAQAL